jgi:hypothetical protein
MEGARMSSTPELEPWQGVLDELLIGPGTPYDVAAIEGLESFDGVRDNDDPLPVGDGIFIGDDYLSGRKITLELEVMATDQVAYPDALAALRWATRPKRDVPFWFRLPTWEEPRRCTVRVRRRSIPNDSRYEMGLAEAAVQLVAPDPVLYGPNPAQLATTFATATGGLQYPLYTDGAGTDLGYLDYGEAPATGRLVVTNTGDAPIWPVYEVDGPVPAQGFQIARTDTGARVQFEAPVPEGSTVRLDSGDGSAVIDGHADRGGALTWRDWWPIGPGESVELAFIRLGPPSTALLRVTAPPGWW